MNSILSQATQNIIKTGLTLSLGAIIYKNLQKLTINSLKQSVHSFVQEQSLQYKKKYVMAKRIILVSSQESEIDLDQSILSKIPNHKITLTESGINNANKIGMQIQKSLEEMKQKNKKQITFSAYSSPFLRAQQTLDQIKQNVNEELIAVSDLNLRDQDMGNLPKNIKSEEIKNEQELVTPFFYRYADGESQADVYHRVNNFVNTITREMMMHDRNLQHQTHDKIILVVAHPLVISQLSQSLKQLDQEDQLLTIDIYQQ